jgi:hypothetical protein
MACPSCGAKPVVPVVRDGYPTIWSWVKPSADLVPVPTEEAIALLEQMNGKVD